MSVASVVKCFEWSVDWKSAVEMSKSIYHFTYQQHKLLCCFTVDSKKSVFKRKCNRMLYLAYLKPSNVIQTSLDRSKKKKTGGSC